MKPILLSLIAVAALAETPDVAAIMARVAENQTAALEKRKDWVFHQKQLLRLHRGNGKLAREERREYAVMPQAKGVEKELTRLEGKYEHKGKYVAYDQPGFSYRDMDIDSDVVNDLSNDMVGAETRDGIGNNLFPLTTQEQAKYNFKLAGIESYRGKPVFRVSFEPKPGPRGEIDLSNSLWKGDALIDTEEFQPVTISTNMAAKLPAAVKILLGTNLKGLGFSVSYQKFADGVWFPVSYGGEFEVRALFLYKRRISISMANADFRRTDVSSKVAFAAEEK
jgi:hypothetical protein